MTIHEIMKKYTAGEAELAETNAALAEAGAGYHLEPGKNELTEEDRRETTVGYYPEQAYGWGLLDTGTGTLDKVHVIAGMLRDDVNEVLPDGSTSMPAYVMICGRTYEVRGDLLAELSAVDPPKRTPVPHLPDMSRRVDLAGQTVRQRTKTGNYDVAYDGDGYAVKAKRVREAEA